MAAQATYADAKAGLWAAVLPESIAEYFLRLCASATRPFPEVVCECDETELHLHFPVRLETEPLEAVVGFDVPEYGLRFNRAGTPVRQTPFACQEFSRLTFE